MIIKCFPKEAIRDTGTEVITKMVYILPDVVGCEVLTVFNKHVNQEDTILEVRTQKEGVFQFNLREYENIYLMNDDGKTVEKFKPQ